MVHSSYYVLVSRRNDGILLWDWLVGEVVIDHDVRFMYVYEKKRMRMRNRHEMDRGFKDGGRILFHSIVGIMWVAVNHTKQRPTVRTSSCE